MNLSYSTVDTHRIGLGVRSSAGWWVWASATPSWTTPFNPAAHVLACTADPDLPMIQTAAIPSAGLLTDGVFVVEFWIGPGTVPTLPPTPVGTLNAPGNYLAFAGGRGSIAITL